MSKQIATRAFYSYIGYNGAGKEISYGDGEIEGEDLGKIREVCLKGAKAHNKNVVSIHLLAVAPLEFETVEPGRTVIQKEIDWKNDPYITGLKSGEE